MGSWGGGGGGGGGGRDSNNTHKIFKLQNRIMRIMSGVEGRRSCRGLFKKKLDIMIVPRQYIMSLILFVIIRLIFTQV
jgi:hypothetical protein